MKRIVIMGGLLLTFLLAACGGSADVAEPAAVEVEEVQSAAPAEAVEAEVEAEVVEVDVEEAAEADLPDPATVVEEAVVEEAVVEEVEEIIVEEEVEAVESDPVMEEVALVEVTEFDKIGQTGRPQFLNSYANW